LLVASASGALPRTGVHIASVEHGPDCAIYRGKPCICVPDISIGTQDGVIVIDECGRATKVARS
jgi:hypothetical protein